MALAESVLDKTNQTNSVVTNVNFLLKVVHVPVVYNQTECLYENDIDNRLINSIQCVITAANFKRLSNDRKQSPVLR